MAMKLNVRRPPLPKPTILGTPGAPVRCARRGCLTPEAEPLLVRTEAGWRPLCRVCRARRIHAVLTFLRRIPGRVVAPLTSQMEGRA